MSDVPEPRRETRESLWLLVVWLLGPATFGVIHIVVWLWPKLDIPVLVRWAIGTHGLAAMTWLVLAVRGRHWRFPEFWMLLVYGVLLLLPFLVMASAPPWIPVALCAAIVAIPLVSLVRWLREQASTPPT